MAGPFFLGRRAGLLGAAAALGGCGFQPLYAPNTFGGDSPVAAELAAIYVPVIPERSGQLLRQALQQRFEGTGTGVAKQYELVAGLAISSDAIAIQRDSTSSRVRLTGVGTWTLRKLDLQHTVLSQGSSRVLDGYNSLSNQFFAADMASDAATRRVAAALADQIAFQVAAFLKQRAGARPA